VFAWTPSELFDLCDRQVEERLWTVSVFIDGILKTEPWTANVSMDT
jgi:hypothetical protein